MIVFGSRGSDLALTQTRAVATALRAATGEEFRIEVIETRGDRDVDRPLPTIGGKGLFTAELEAALKPTIRLPSGGSIVIELTEALTVIDVNSGKLTQSKSLQDTVLRTNLEAAEEIIRGKW